MCIEKALKFYFLQSHCLLNIYWVWRIVLEATVGPWCLLCFLFFIFVWDQRHIVFYMFFGLFHFSLIVSNEFEENISVSNFIFQMRLNKDALSPIFTSVYLIFALIVSYPTLPLSHSRSQSHSHSHADVLCRINGERFLLETVGDHRVHDLEAGLQPARLATTSLRSPRSQVHRSW